MAMDIIRKQKKIIAVLWVLLLMSLMLNVCQWKPDRKIQQEIIEEAMIPESVNLKELGYFRRKNNENLRFYSGGTEHIS